MDVLGDGDVHEGHEDLAGHADGHPEEVDPPEAQAEVAGEPCRSLDPGRASTAAPKNPAHSPNRVDTTYQVGGSLSRAMAAREPSFPVTAALTATKTAARIWPAEETEGGEQQPDPGRGAAVGGGALVELPAER